RAIRRWGTPLPLPARDSMPPADSPLIAGRVLPIQRAEDLLATLPGVISARIIAGGNGAVDEIHLLTTVDVTPKQTVRNVESALMAHLGMRVSHKKISVATSDDAQRPQRMTTPGYPIPALHATPSGSMPAMAHAAVPPASPGLPPLSAMPLAYARSFQRRLYFED